MASPQVKIDSPYAKFGIGGQLSCTLCNCSVKSAKVWIAHVNGRQHRESLAARNKQANVNVDKKSQPQLQNSGKSSEGLKRKVEPQQSQPQSKRQREELPDGFFDGKMEAEEPQPQAGELPEGFFENAKAEAKAPEPQPVQSQPQAGELPEGFFDNRKMDAKARGVELKDPLDDEWSKFQKEIQKVEVVSEKIVEEDEGVNTLERDLDEVEEQMREWSRINELEKKKGTLEIIGKDGDVSREPANESSSDELDDVNLDEVLDWRSKDVWK